jgi:hypothetical protein
MEPEIFTKKRTAASGENQTGLGPTAPPHVPRICPLPLSVQQQCGHERAPERWRRGARQERPSEALSPRRSVRAAQQE